MRVIVCNIQLFSCDQMIYVLEDGKQIFAQKVDIEDVAPAVCVLAKEYDAEKIAIGGNHVYGSAWAERIKTDYTLAYGKNNLEVEII